MSYDLPGVETVYSVLPREVLLTHEGRIQVPIVLDPLKAIDGANGEHPEEIRAGWLLGRIAATGRWVPCKRTTVVSADGESATFSVENAAPFQAGDTVTVGPATGKVIASVDYAADTITLTASIEFDQDDAVFAEDGSATCRGVLGETVRLVAADGVTPVPKGASLILQGLVRSSQILGDSAACRADTASASLLAGVRFSADYGL